MAAQIQIQDTVIELGEEINYNFQVGDIAEISKSKSTYTSSFKIPRLSEFERIFNGLAIPGDRSQYPYQINDVYLLDDYVPIMRGVLVFMRTDELYFNVTAISGAFDFFTEIGDTKFSDIDISEIVHEKTLDVVADRIEGLILQPYGGHYTYGFAQFGGMSHYTDGGGPVTVNIDALCPVVTARYLWDKIFEAFPRFTFSGDFYSSQDFEQLWVVFPYGPYVETGEWVDKIQDGKQSYAFSSLNFPFDANVLDPGEISVSVDGRVITAISDGWIKINVRSFRADFNYTPSPPEPTPNTGTLVFRKNSESTFFLQVESRPNPVDGEVAEHNIYLEAGDTITMEFRTEDFFEDGYIFDLDIMFSRLSLQDTSKVFGLGIKTFIKEVMWRYGLLAFVDNNHIDFVRMGDIIESGEVVDWSDKYVRRTEEEYTLDYNQNNWLRHKYDDEDADYFDRNIEVDNKNIPTAKTIIESNFYAPVEEASSYTVYSGTIIQALHFPIFDPDYRTNDFSEDTQYKARSRYFFARVESENLPYRIGSATMGGAVDSPLTPGTTKLVHIITFADLPFAENPYYDALTKILNPTRAHRIELKLTAIDVNQLSLKRLYYFEQEQSRYMLNKLQYKRGTVAKGEFIKISETITDTWVASGETCQLDGGYRTGWVEYTTLTSPLTGATKPNVPGDPNYVAPDYDPIQCVPQSSLVVSNQDTDRTNPYRLFVDADVAVFINSVQVAYITDVETRTLVCNTGDTIRIVQRSNPNSNPWPPGSRSDLTINGDRTINSSQNEIMQDRTFSALPGANSVSSTAWSIATDMRKFTVTTIVNTPIPDPASIMFIVMEDDYTVRGVKHSWNDYTSEFNTTDDSNDLIISIHNSTPNPVLVDINSIQHTVGPNTVEDVEVPKSNLTIIVG